MILIRNGRVLDPAGGLDAVREIEIENGRIASVLEPGRSAGRTYERVIDATGCVVAPGFVDVHVHFRDPGLTYKEDIQTGASAAAAGGYTTVICMANTKPPVDSEETLRDLIGRAKDLPIHVYQTATVTVGMKGKVLTDMDGLRAAGAVGFTDDGLPITDEQVLIEALRKCRDLDVPISLHEEDPVLLRSQGVNQGKVSDALGLGGASDEAEYVLAARDVLLNRHIGAKLDIQHISSGVTVEILRMAKKIGVRVYGEVTPQHLAATEDLVLEKGSLARVNPPLRIEADRLALIRGLADGTIDMIATDHAPHSREEKAAPIASAPSGMIGLETALGLVLDSVVHPGHADLMTVLRAMTVNPADLYGLDAGRITVGGPADLVLFDPNETWTVTEEHFRSKSANSPFIGRTLRGKVKKTICRGEIVYED